MRGKLRGKEEDAEEKTEFELDIGDPATIPKEVFQELIIQRKAIEVPDWSKSHEEYLLKFLKKKAATADAIAQALHLPRDTVIKAIEHLRFHNKRIVRYYNLNDRKYYYVLMSEEERR